MGMIGPSNGARPRLVAGSNAKQLVGGAGRLLFAGIADAGIAVSAMPTPHSSAAASFLRFDMLVSSGYPPGYVATGNFNP